MRTPDEIVEADLTWTGRRFESGIRVVVRDGRMVEVGAMAHPPTRRLERQALLPGFVNAHSHAFQRGLRARGERFAPGTGSFWTWRDAMYQLVETMTPDRFRSLCVRAFEEMLDAGITAVGEFHYLHHSAGRTDFAYDALVMDAAAEAGIRIVLLNTFYRTAGLGRPLVGAQRRFQTDTVAAYWEGLDRLAEHLRPPLQSLGVVGHSLRAVPIDDLASLQAGALQRGLVLHLHLEEQQQEVHDVRAAYGQTPMAALLAAVDVRDNTTAVHCTHTRPDQLARFLEAGGRVCVCPTTEANLGDGIPALAPEAAPRLCLGTDSNVRISMLEEMRWLEYGQRLRRQSRGVLADAEGSVGRQLLSAATEQGAAALGLDAGRIAAGAWADLVAIDLHAPGLAEVEPDGLADALAFSASEDVIVACCVGGRWRVPRRLPRQPV